MPSKISWEEDRIWDNLAICQAKIPGEEHLYFAETWTRHIPLYALPKNPSYFSLFYISPKIDIMELSNTY